ncbi:ABC transporter ATP-binding protein [Bacillus sp. FJAT-44742]|uniref:ABC transporter ATP-binding protein n=1 Tax=Bacillus sp. FJAT-44742 TaxID=2014005 RepID=UPI000C24D0A0|nr:ABC transporter ATP-binding protein [Bacillus sp. FJAT-44742]
MFSKLKEPFSYEKRALSHGNKNALVKKRPQADNWKDTLKRIWLYLSYRKGKLFFVLFLVLLSSAFALLGPFMIGMAIDNYVVTGDLGALRSFLLGLVFVYLIHSGSLLLQNFLMAGIAQQTVYTMRTDLFTHLHSLPIPFFDKKQHGELMSRVTNDMENVSNTLNSSVIQIFSSLLTLIGTISVMLWLSPLLTLITLLIVPAMVYGMKWITKRTGRLFKEQQRDLGDVNGYIEETMSGHSIVKTFSLEKRVIDSFMEKNGRLRQSGFWAQTISGFIPKLMNMLNNLSFAVIAGVGGILALQGVITIGVIVIFAEYARQFTRPLNDLANQVNTLLSAIAGAERVFEVMDEKDERSDEKGAAVLSEVKGEITFSNVSFAYERDEQTLTEVTFTAHAGETIAFVGPTGAGKTTIINLLSRFYDPDKGEIQLDGRNMAHIKRESVRSHMAFVLQDSFLFQGTIRENIRYGNLSASDEEVERAARLANADGFIQKFPEKYETTLKQNGQGISQGQKQLLSIARAILADPAILILDEATSSIDTVTEIKIQEALQRLMKGRTSFVIAHRLNTIRQADQIIVLQHGKITEKGSHEELMNNKGFYAELQAGQTKEQAV